MRREFQSQSGCSLIDNSYIKHVVHIFVVEIFEFSFIFRIIILLLLYAAGRARAHVHKLSHSVATL